jgi:hypothetical protein
LPELLLGFLELKSRLFQIRRRFVVIAIGGR